MPSKKTLVLGASDNPERYSFKAINSLKAHQHTVVAIGNKTGIVNGISIEKEKILIEDLDTITLYLNPQRQKEYYDYIISLAPKRIIFNPGTENEELENKAKQHQIETIEACTLVLLSTNQY